MNCICITVMLCICWNLEKWCLRNNRNFFLSSIFCLNCPSLLIFLTIPKNYTTCGMARYNNFDFFLILEVPIRIHIFSILSFLEVLYISDGNLNFFLVTFNLFLYYWIFLSGHILLLLLLYMVLVLFTILMFEVSIFWESGNYLSESSHYFFELFGTKFLVRLYVSLLKFFFVVLSIWPYEYGES